SLDQAAAALGNTSMPFINQITNFFAKQTGDPRIDRFNLAATAAVNEMERAYRQSGGSEGDIKRWHDSLNAAQSPEQFAGVLRQAADLLGSKINEMGEQYNKGMGTTSDGMTLLSPKAQSVYNRLTT